MDDDARSRSSSGADPVRPTVTFGCTIVPRGSAYETAERAMGEFLSPATRNSVAKASSNVVASQKTPSTAPTGLTPTHVVGRSSDVFRTRANEAPAASEMAEKTKATTTSTSTTSTSKAPSSLRPASSTTVTSPLLLSLGTSTASPQKTPEKRARKPRVEQPEGTVPYVVVDGDTIVGLCVRFAMAEQDLLMMNRLVGRTLFSGQTLYVRDPSRSPSKDVSLIAPAKTRPLSAREYLKRHSSLKLPGTSHNVSTSTATSKGSSANSSRSASSSMDMFASLDTRGSSGHPPLSHDTGGAPDDLIPRTLSCENSMGLASTTRLQSRQDSSVESSSGASTPSTGAPSKRQHRARRAFDRIKRLSTNSQNAPLAEATLAFGETSYCRDGRFRFGIKWITRDLGVVPGVLDIGDKSFNFTPDSQAPIVCELGAAAFTLSFSILSLTRCSLSDDLLYCDSINRSRESSAATTSTPPRRPQRPSSLVPATVPNSAAFVVDPLISERDTEEGFALLTSGISTLISSDEEDTPEGQGMASDDDDDDVVDRRSETFAERYMRDGDGDGEEVAVRKLHQQQATRERKARQRAERHRREIALLAVCPRYMRVGVQRSGSMIDPYVFAVPREVSDTIYSCIVMWARNLTDVLGDDTPWEDIADDDRRSLASLQLDDIIDTPPSTTTVKAGASATPKNAAPITASDDVDEQRSRAALLESLAKADGATLEAVTAEFADMSSQALKNKMTSAQIYPGGAFVMAAHALQFQDEAITSEVLFNSDMPFLGSALPRRLRRGVLRLVYSTFRHGRSINTLYRNCRSMVGHEQEILTVIRDQNDHTFGAFCTAPWQVVDNKYYGSGESFLFTLSPERCSFPWAGHNDYFMMSDLNGLCMGGGDGVFGLYVSNDLRHGSSGQSLTFGNPPLSSGVDFSVRVLEVWEVLESM